MFQPNSVIALLILFFVPFAAASNQPLIVNVSHENGVYSSSLSTSIDAQRDDVYSLLTAYDNLPSFSRLIYKSRSLTNGHLLLKLKACFIIICFDKQLTLSLKISKNAIVGYVIPDHSDFKYGLMKWQLSDNQAGTFIRFSGKLVPDFWVPPIIGPILIKSKLRSEAKYSIRQLERLSQPNNHPQKKAP